MDPKEYLPFLEGMSALADTQRRIAIDTHLKRYDSAVACMSASGDIDAAVTLAKATGSTASLVAACAGTGGSARALAAHAEVLGGGGRGAERAAVVMAGGGGVGDAVADLVEQGRWQVRCCRGFNTGIQL